MASFNYGKVFSEGRSVGDFGDSIDMGMKLGLNEHAKKYNELSRGLSSAKTENDIKNTYQYPLQEIGNKQDYLLIRVYERRPQNSSFSNELPGVVDAQLPGGETVKAIKMPGRITMMDDRFRIDSTPKNGVESNLTTLQKDMKHIYLPIPQSVSDSLAVSYAEDTLNPLQGLGLQLVEKGITDPGEVGSAAMELLKGAGALGSAIDSRVEKLVASALSGVALNQLGANVNPMTMITRSSGQILQSNLELLFSGVTLRSFPFTFDFVPRSKTEADEVKGIIRVLKRAVVPKNGRQAVFINAPSQFHFEYKSGMNTHPFLNKFKVGVLSELSVNYNGSGAYSTYWDGTPTHIQVTCMYKEVSPIYQEDYDAIPPEEGVGY
tara:strand:- start:770 stop:1903 length:1134 start_codon:yes stop_codon:yes gene_type:complete